MAKPQLGMSDKPCELMLARGTKHDWQPARDFAQYEELSRCRLPTHSDLVLRC